MAEAGGFPGSAERGRPSHFCEYGELRNFGKCGRLHNFCKCGRLHNFCKCGRLHNFCKCGRLHNFCKCAGVPNFLFFLNLPIFFPASSGQSWRFGCTLHPASSIKDTLAERLRRRPAKPMGSPRVGSNPTGVVFIFFAQLPCSRRLGFGWSSGPSSNISS